MGRSCSHGPMRGFPYSLRFIRVILWIIDSNLAMDSGFLQRVNIPLTPIEISPQFWFNAPNHCISLLTRCENSPVTGDAVIQTRTNSTCLSRAIVDHSSVWSTTTAPGQPRVAVGLTLPDIRVDLYCIFTAGQPCLAVDPLYPEIRVDFYRVFTAGQPRLAVDSLYPDILVDLLVFVYPKPTATCGWLNPPGHTG